MKEDTVNLVKLSIRKRIYGGSAILVALSLGLALFTINEAINAEAQVTRLGMLSDNNTRALQIARELEALSRSMNAYKMSGDEAALQDNRDADNRASELLAQAETQSISQERRAIYHGVKDALDVYKTKLETLGGLVREAKLGRDRLFSIGEELTAATNAVIEVVRSERNPALSAVSAEIESAILLVRVSNWRFLATLDAKGPATFRANVEKARSALARLDGFPGVPDDLRVMNDRIRAAIGGYAGTFDQVSAAMTKSEVLFEELRQLIIPVQASIETAGNSLRKDYGATQETTKQTVRSSILMEEITAAGALLIGIAIAFLLGRGIIRPIAGMTSAMSKLAAGDTDVTVPSRDATDEMGAMAKAVDIFKENAIARRKLEDTQKQRDANAAAEKQQAMAVLADSFEDAVGEIIDTVSSSATELEASAGSLTATAERSQELTTMVAAASEEASTNVQSVASATEEMASSVNEISRQVQDSARIASDAVAQAEKTNDRIGLLAQAAGRIGAVVELINSIAGQTNLLALNATIEAARAGEAGRGFAVVASEVKALAEQTAKATGEISQQISGMQAATDESVVAIRDIGATIGRLSEIASTIASAVEEQGAATQEIARNVQQAAQGTMQVSANITDVQRGASETGSASSQVLSAAQSLSKDSNRLKSEVGKFLDTVRAA